MAVAGHRGRVSLCLRRRHRGTERGVGDGRGPVCVCVCVCVGRARFHVVIYFEPSVCGMKASVFSEEIIG